MRLPERPDLERMASFCSRRLKACARAQRFISNPRLLRTDAPSTSRRVWRARRLAGTRWTPRRCSPRRSKGTTGPSNCNSHAAAFGESAFDAMDGAGHYKWLCRSDRAPNRQCFLRSRQDNDSGCAAVAAHAGPWPAGGKMRSRREQSVAKPALMSGTLRRGRGGWHYSASQRLANPIQESRVHMIVISIISCLCLYLVRLHHLHHPPTRRRHACRTGTSSSTRTRH